MNEPLKLWFNGEDWVVAVSAERAKAYVLETAGYDAGEVEDFDEWPADRPLTLLVEGDKELEERSQLPAAWVAEHDNQETHLGSVNW